MSAFEQVVPGPEAARLEIRGLYPIVDVDSLEARGLDVIDFAQEVLKARPSILQLRAKSSGARDTLALLRRLRSLCTASAALLFANDRADLAELSGCDGVHVGQDDLPISEVRRLFPKLKVGVSTHDLTQLERALDTAPDYVAYGPIFPTQSKANPDPVVGLEQLRAVCARARPAGVSVVAIGGITLDSAPEIRNLGAAGAVIGGLLPSQGSLTSPADRAVALQRALRGG